MAFCSSENNNSQHKTPRVTPLGVFCFSQCFRVFPTDRVPHSDSLFAERISGVRSQPAGSPPTPPKSPLQLSMSLLNTPLRVNNPVLPGAFSAETAPCLTGSNGTPDRQFLLMTKFQRQTGTAWNGRQQTIHDASSTLPCTAMGFRIRSLTPRSDG